MSAPTPLDAPAAKTGSDSPHYEAEQHSSPTPPELEVGGRLGAEGRSCGPKTAAGKAVSARNATTHGLFCRQTVLPHLGEDPQAYRALLDTLHEQIRPRNLMERQYIELWADASWKLRRLSRLEAQVWEDETLGEDDRLTRLERLSRLQSGTRRQLDKAVRMLGHDVHALFTQRTREDVLHRMDLTEDQLIDYAFRRRDVERTVQANTYWLDPDDHIPGTLDNTPPLPSDSPSIGGRGAIPSSSPEREGGEVFPDGVQRAGGVPENCENELPADAPPPQIRPRVSRRLPETPVNAQRLRAQDREERLNNPKVPLEERRRLAAAPGVVFTEDALRIRA